MPRESRAIDKYDGSEIEYGISSPDSDKDPAELAREFVSLIRSEWLSGGGFSSWDARPRLSDGEDHGHSYFQERSWREMNYLLANGGRLYVDGAHPELSTTLCRTPKEELSYYMAADRIMQFLVERYREEGIRFFLLKNNYGFSRSRWETLCNISPELLADHAAHGNKLPSCLGLGVGYPNASSASGKSMRRQVKIGVSRTVYLLESVLRSSMTKSRKSCGLSVSKATTKSWSSNPNE